MKLYPKALRKNAKAALPAGTSFKATRFKTAGSIKNPYGSTRPYYNAYLYVKTDSGKTGWLYFPAKYSSYAERYLKYTGEWG